MEQLRKVFPSVRMLTAEQVQAGEAVGDAARQALEEKTTHSRMEYRGQELYEVTALFAQVEGTPCVLELERRLDRIMLLDPEESEQLFNNLAEYRGKLYRDAVTGAYNERYYQEKYRSRILTAGVAVLRVDDFKAANDVYGRYAGNSVLETVAGVLRRNLGEKDRLIRRGEDRLLLLLPEVGQSDFGQKLEHLRLQLAAAGVPVSAIACKVLFPVLLNNRTIGSVKPNNTPYSTAAKPSAVQIVIRSSFFISGKSLLP